jgi:TolA-binding protein
MERNTRKSFEFVKEDINNLANQLSLMQKEINVLKENQRFLMQEIMVLNNKLMNNEIPRVKFLKGGD